MWSTFCSDAVLDDGSHEMCAGIEHQIERMLMSPLFLIQRQTSMSVSRFCLMEVLIENSELVDSEFA